MAFSPFTITDSATPLVVELSPGLERTSLSDASDRPAYVYDGPYGPVFGAYDDRLTRTRWWGPHVPDTTLRTGPELAEDPARASRELRAGIEGNVGELTLVLRRTADRDTRTTREIAAQLGPGHYVLRAAGLLPRVALHRPTGPALASYTLRGRRPHGLVDDATAAEAILALLMTAFVPRLAYTG